MDDFFINVEQVPIGVETEPQTFSERFGWMVLSIKVECYCDFSCVLAENCTCLSRSTEHECNAATANTYDGTDIPPVYSDARTDVPAYGATTDTIAETANAPSDAKTIAITTDAKMITTTTDVARATAYLAPTGLIFNTTDSRNLYVAIAVVSVVLVTMFIIFLIILKISKHRSLK